MERTLKRSRLHFERALTRLPLGVSADSGYWGDDRTFYVKRALGARLHDLDDNEYIDYRLGGGQVILGYADRRIARAARAGIEIGGALSLATELELAVAERIARMVPGAQLVRFSSSSADAIADALRVARIHAGRDEIAIVEGSHAWLLGDATRHEGRAPGSDAEPSRAAAARRGAFDAWFHCMPRNDADACEALLCKQRDRIGALLVEPIPLSPAQAALDAGYLASLRSLCDRFEIALIVDESTTGFRVARGGAQQALGVRADLCTFGPSIANGFPIAALAGREPIMRGIGRQVAQGVGAAAHPLSLAVADKTLQLLEETDALERIAKYGARMREGMSQVLTRRGIPHSLAGPPSMIRLSLGALPQQLDGSGGVSAREFASALAPRLHGFGILCDAELDAPWFVSAAHNELCLAETLAKFEHATDAMLELQSGAHGRSTRATHTLSRAFANPS